MKRITYRGEYYKVAMKMLESVHDKNRGFIKGDIYNYFMPISSQILNKFTGEEITDVVFYDDDKDMYFSLYTENCFSLHMTKCGSVSIIIDNENMCFREKYGETLLITIEYDSGYFSYLVHDLVKGKEQNYPSGFEIKAGRKIKNITLEFSTPLIISAI